MTDRPKVSICIPAYGRPVELHEAIESALAQTYADVEVVIGDDSADLAETVATFADPRVKYIRNAARLGMAGNYTNVLDSARGEFVMILMDDDRLLPRFIEAVVERLEADEDIGIAFTNVYFSEGGTLHRRPSLLREGKHDHFLPLVVRHPISVNMSSAVLRREVWQDVRPLPDLLTADTVMYVSAAVRGWSFFYVDEPLVVYRLHEGQLSHSEVAMRRDAVRLWELFEFDDAECERLRRTQLASALVYRGATHLKQGRVDDARADLKRAATVDESALRLRRNLLSFLARRPSYVPLAMRLTHARVPVAPDVSEEPRRADERRPRKAGRANVSICIPAYGRPRELKQAIESALMQTYGELEVIVGDDSGDLVQAVTDFRDPRLRYVRNERRLGMAANWTNVLDLAEGRYVGLLMDDDRLMPQFVEKATAELERDPTVAIAFTNHYYEENGRLEPRRHRLEGGKYADFLPHLLIHNPLPVAVSAALMRRELWEELRPLPDLLTADLVMYLTAAIRGRGFFYIDEPLMAYRLHEDQLSRSEERFRGDEVLAWEMFEFENPEYERLRETKLARSLVGRGASNLKHGRFEEAAADLARAGRLDPSALATRRRLLTLLCRYPGLTPLAIRVARARPPASGEDEWRRHGGRRAARPLPEAMVR